MQSVAAEIILRLHTRRIECLFNAVPVIGLLDNAGPLLEYQLECLRKSQIQLILQPIRNVPLEHLVQPGFFPEPPFLQKLEFVPLHAIPFLFTLAHKYRHRYSPIL